MKKKALTLIEIMIVILLITLIGGAIGYNVKGSLKKGREFKTKQAQQQLADILEICLQEGTSVQQILADTEEAVKSTGLAKDPKKLLNDGNGVPFEITYDDRAKAFRINVARS
jgi:type II secretory pathway pseudopilin PulG